jgi:hypothetical protein
MAFVLAPPVCYSTGRNVRASEGSTNRRRAPLGQYDFAWWTDAVLPVTEELVKAGRGQPTPAFWRCLYKQEDESGGPYLSGWLVRLLPYLKGGTPNPLLGVPWDRSVGDDAADFGPRSGRH